MNCCEAMSLVKEDGVGAVAGGSFAKGLLGGNKDFCSLRDLSPAKDFGSDAFMLAKGFIGVVVALVVVVLVDGGGIEGFDVELGAMFAKGFEEDDEPKEKVEVGNDGVVVFIEPNKPPELGTGGFVPRAAPLIPF